MPGRLRINGSDTRGLGDEYAKMIADQASVRDPDFHSGRFDRVYLRQIWLDFLMSTDRTERHSNKSKRVALGGFYHLTRIKKPLL